MSQTGHNPIAIANYLIGLSEGKGLTLMQLLKLSYISHGFTLALLDKPLADEYAEAWKFGPVFPSIYHEFKYEKPKPIKEKAKRLTEINNKQVLEDFSSTFDRDEEKIIEVTYKDYGDLTGWELSAITHAKDTPWYKAWEEGEHIRGFSISNEEIKNHYKKLMNNRQINS